MRFFGAILLSILFASAAIPQAKHALTFDDLIGMGRISDPQISPDRKMVVFVLTYYNNPRWMPDGASVAFVSTRDGESQIWTIPVSGGESKKVSLISTEASGLTVSADGRWFAFSSDVFPDCATDDCNRARNEELSKSKIKAKMFDHLPYRVWNYWKDGRRSHMFVMPATGGKAVDLTPGDYDTPPIDLGGSWDYDFSPDGKEVVFTRNTDPVVAVSTNNDLFTVPVSGGAAKRITENPANDSQPLYSPDGKYIAYREMERA